MFEYPSQYAPDTEMRIRLNPQNMVAWNSGMWHWALGHEMTHYAFLLRENGWQEKKWYENRLKHHCDHEFMTITQNIAELLWEIYEKSEDRLHMYIEANKSCRHQPNQ
jgi:predicted SprT family Zn-dependent metalloprotease